MIPFSDVTFFQFFPLFFSRFFLLLKGELPFSDLCSDEIQVLVLALVSVAAAIVGTLLMLRKMTMLANSLSHTILLGIVISYLLFHGAAKTGLSLDFKVLIGAALLSGLLTTGLTQLLHRGLRLQEDASIGLVFTTLFALGIGIATLYTRSAHIGLESVMGNADALHFEDLKISLGSTLTSALFLLLFFKEWKLTSFDLGLAKSLGMKPSFYSYLLMLLTSLVAIASFRAVGVLLFLSFLVGLPLIGRRLSNHLGSLLILASSLGLLLSLVGVALSRHIVTKTGISLSTAGLISCLISLSYLLLLPFDIKKKFGIMGQTHG